jgi:hypothetical protein
LIEQDKILSFPGWPFGYNAVLPIIFSFIRN